MAALSVRWSSFSEWLLSSRAAERILLGIVLALFAIGNLPWHLDDYDQAKQAYVSHEIAHGGSWWFQHTPRGDTATKPPLAGWISLAIVKATGSWDLGWRLPGFLCAAVLLWLLIRAAERILPRGGALLVTAAFGLNLLSPRIATLVRTDMMLTLWITICGLLIYQKISTGTAWTDPERWIFCAAMVAAFFTKGPILYVFILPGLLAFYFLGPKDRRGAMWCGWWPWLLPLVLFLAWGITALLTNKEFYDDVVVKELFSRFDQSLKSYEKQQPIWFYFPHLLHKFLPWSVLALALPIVSKSVRQRIKADPGTLWLACWALGGLLLMTFIPSKRVDRIFPIIPPLCLLLVAMVAACQGGERVRRWCAGAVVAGFFLTTGYFVAIVIDGFVHKSNAMVLFGDEVQRRARAAGYTRIGVVQPRDEGMIIYCGGEEYLHAQTATQRWQKGELDVLVFPERRMTDRSLFPEPALISGDISKQGESKYLLFIRPR